MSQKKKINFARFAQEVVRRAGHPTSFGMAVGFLAAWLIFGPLLDYHPAWMQFIGITTGIFTFLMVFLLQNTQNRDNEALQIKLDELLKVLKGTNKDVINAENLDEHELDALKKRYEHLMDKDSTKS